MLTAVSNLTDNCWCRQLCAYLSIYFLFLHFVILLASLNVDVRNHVCSFYTPTSSEILSHNPHVNSKINISFEHSRPIGEC
jgi:hypothetical protein